MTSERKAEQAEQATAPSQPPQIVLDQANAAAEAADTDDPHHHHDPHAHHHGGTGPNIEHVPPPAYSNHYGSLKIEQNGMETGAKVQKDGRVNIKFCQSTNKLSNLLAPALRRQLEMHKAEAAEPCVPEGLGETPDGLPPPPMNLVIQIVGSRGDVQPFIALGQVLKNKFGHRVRVATHPTFREFVVDNGLEFFSIGGDPAELMAFMVKNPGLMPGMDSLKSGDVGKRRKGIYEIVTGCWRSCIEPGEGTGIPASDALVDDARSFDSAMTFGDPTQKPFIADAIIANPPSFAHMHIGEKLGIPVHLMFTMPWSPTQSFPHPLANIISSNTDPNIANFVSYALVDMLTWQGLGDVINRFRQRSLGLEPVSIMWAPGMASRLRIPWTYCWSPALIPKPADWGNHIDISGFYFLNLASNFTPDPELAAFLEAGPPPVYIGFGSIVVEDPNAMTKMIFDAVKKTGQRALVSKGWGGLGADEMGIPDGVFMLGNCPHDWLFKKVSCVVHHGGAGTTAAGIAAGRPTVVVPFFGDQPFWGAMCARAGAGPMPIPYKELTADKLTDQINKALEPASLERAKELCEKIRAEDGSASGAESFHKQLRVDDLRCSLCPDRVAVWRVRRTDIRLSALAATVLGNEGLLDFNDLKLYRAREYETDDGPWDPVTGGASALIGTIGQFSMGIADFPVEILKSLKQSTSEVKEGHERHKSQTSTSLASSGPPTSGNASSSDLTKVDTKSTQDSSNMSTHELTASPQAENSPVVSPPRTPSLSTAKTVVDEQPQRGRRSIALASVLGPDGESRTNSRRFSDGSRSRSRDPRFGEEFRPAEDLQYITMESAISGAKAAGRIASAGIKSPMDFTLSIAKGFHNAPKLYGDETVRKTEKITDFQSGLKVAGKELGYGFFDGITGLVTQPLAGARKEGAAGFIKGAAKGFGGLILKPGAGIWGIPGYTSKGVYAEIIKHFGSSAQNFIIAARTTQGYEEWKDSSPEQRIQIVSGWKASKLELRKNGKKFGKERAEELENHILTRTPSNNTELLSGFKNTRKLTWDERKALAARKEDQRKREKGQKRLDEQMKKGQQGSSQHSRLRHSATAPVPKLSSQPDVHDEYERAIQASVAATSTGNPQEDVMIERALRASVNELQRSQTNPATAQPDEAYSRAVKASIEEAKKARTELGSDSHATEQDQDHDAELEKVLTRSLEEYKAGQAAAPSHAGHGHWDDESDSGHDTEADEEFKRTIEESKRLHTEQLDRQRPAANPSGQATSATPTDNEHDEELQRAMTESERESKRDEEELRRAMTESEQHSKDNEEKIAKQRTEEEIVLEYVKKQSLLEEEHRKNKMGGASG